MRKIIKYFKSLIKKVDNKPVDNQIISNDLGENKHLSELFQKQISEIMKINTELVEMMNDGTIDPSELDNKISDKNTYLHTWVD
jgi:uncharacterized protein YfkK (UPF0435 family)